MLARDRYRSRLLQLLGTFPAVAVLGPRQCGKSTLVRRIADARKRAVFFDLERPSDLAQLREAPERELAAAQRKGGLICLDEVQRAPELLPLLRPLIDDRARRARYVLLGSASPELVAAASETLAGRIGFLDLTPLLASEVGTASDGRRDRHWVRGGLPPSFLARSERASVDWRDAYVRTFLERDVPALGLRLPAPALHRLWTMLAHLHGGLVNSAELASGLGVSAPTVQRWLDVLEGTFMIRRLAPYWTNVGKRLTKAPRVYIRDTGILHSLLGISDAAALRSHPKRGASWEGWVIEQIVGGLASLGEAVRPHFWRTHGGAEVDLVLELRGRQIPIEIKLGTPEVSRGLIECAKDLGAAAAFVVHGGSTSHGLGEGRWALSARLVDDPARLLRTLLDAEGVVRA